MPWTARDLPFAASAEDDEESHTRVDGVPVLAAWGSTASIALRGVNK
jgi:hypothetical protein